MGNLINNFEEDSVAPEIIEVVPTVYGTKQLPQGRNMRGPGIERSDTLTVEDTEGPRYQRNPMRDDLEWDDIFENCTTMWIKKGFWGVYVCKSSQIQDFGP